MLEIYVKVDPSHSLLSFFVFLGLAHVQQAQILPAESYQPPLEIICRSQHNGASKTGVYRVMRWGYHRN